MMNSLDERLEMIEPHHPSLSIRRQCDLLGINRSTYYFESAQENSLNLALMREIDELHLEHPFLGSRRMAELLGKKLGKKLNRKRIQRLMCQIGIQALFPKPNTSRPNAEHRIYPYLLRNVAIERPWQVLSTDITYIPMPKGYLYLVAVMDWFSRYIVSWEVSNSMDISFCISALQTALSQGTPEVFNTDQGAQFTSPRFTNILSEREIQISMDGRGRALDNIWIERFWRSLKYEEVYLKEYETVGEAVKSIQKYIQFYNFERPHQSLNYATPAFYFNRKSVRKELSSPPKN